MRSSTEWVNPFCPAKFKKCLLNLDRFLKKKNVVSVSVVLSISCQGLHYYIELAVTLNLKICCIPGISQKQIFEFRMLPLKEYTFKIFTIFQK